ncbi:MAG: CDP-diacylglycerol--glycerol-3-phosphate 3-phosphatidyltransferase [Nitrospira sp.]|nr:CDP-diacylglycerol--glycerol-3-phosphate 3-phosphatidyltransferase [Nitrospira sp.]
MSPVHVAKAQPKSVPVNDRTERTFNLPNALTFLRILLVPVYIGLFSTPTAVRSTWAAAIFGLAALTDWLDGYIARRRGQVTKIGRLFDPIADKFLVISGLVLLVQFQRIAAWLAIALIVRDLAVTGIRFVSASRGIIIAAGTLGKYKVVLQIIAIIILTLEGAVSFSFLNMHLLGTVTLYVALLFSLVSAGQYLLEAWNEFSQKGCNS